MDNNSSSRISIATSIHNLLDAEYLRRCARRTNGCSGFVINEDLYLRGFWIVLASKVFCIDELANPLDIASVENALTSDPGAEKLMSRMMNKVETPDSIEIRTINKDMFYKMLKNDSKATYVADTVGRGTISYVEMVGHKYEHDKQFNYRPMLIKDCKSSLSCKNELVVEIKSKFAHIVGESLKDPKTVVVYICDLSC